MLCPCQAEFGTELCIDQCSWTVSLLALHHYVTKMCSDCSRVDRPSWHELVGGPNLPPNSNSKRRVWCSKITWKDVSHLYKLELWAESEGFPVFGTCSSNLEPRPSGLLYCCIRGAHNIPTNEHTSKYLQDVLLVILQHISIARKLERMLAESR